MKRTNKSVKICPTVSVISLTWFRYRSPLCISTVWLCSLQTVYSTEGDSVDVNMGKRSVTVHYLDFGSMEQLRFDQVYQIPSDILEYPILRVECFLAKVKPSFKESPDGTWTLKSRAFFSNLALNQVCYSYFHG